MHTNTHRPTGLQWTQRGDVGEVKGEKISEKVTERLLCRFLMPDLLPMRMLEDKDKWCSVYATFAK